MNNSKESSNQTINSAPTGEEVMKWVNQLKECLEGSNEAGEYEALKELHECAYRAKVEDPYIIFENLFNILVKGVSIKSQVKREIAAISNSFLRNLVFENMKQGSVPMPEEIKKKWETKIEKMRNLIVESEITNGLVFELKCMKTGVALLNTETTTSEKAIKILGRVFVGVKDLIEDKNPKELIDMGIEFFEAARKTNNTHRKWYMQQMYLRYLEKYTDPTLIVKQMKKILENESDWHVIYDALTILERAVINKNSVGQKSAIDLVLSYKDFNEKEGWRVREKVAEICALVIAVQKELQICDDVVERCSKTHEEMISNNKQDEKVLRALKNPLQVITVQLMLQKDWRKEPNKKEKDLSEEQKKFLNEICKPRDQEEIRREREYIEKQLREMFERQKDFIIREINSLKDSCNKKSEAEIKSLEEELKEDLESYTGMIKNINSICSDLLGVPLKLDEMKAMHEQELIKIVSICESLGCVSEMLKEIRIILGKIYNELPKPKQFSDIEKSIKESQTEQLKEFREKQLEMYVAEKGSRDYDDIQKARSKESKEEKDSEEKVFDLDEKVRQYLAGERKVLLLMGGSGTGKSTYSQYLVHSLLNEKNDIPGIPLYVNLVAIDNPEKDLMKNVLISNGILENEIPMLKASCKFVLILDGYDEIGTLQNLYVSNKLSEWNVKVIVTCRSQYLMGNGQYQNKFVPYDRNRVPQWNQFEEMVMAPFDETQINEYIKRYVEKNKATLVWKDWEKYREEINKISDLLKIIDTPFLLSMVMEVLPGIVREDEKDANRIEALRLKKIDIYDAFINRWFEKEEARLTIMINLPEHGSDIKIAFRGYSERLAIKMLNKGVTTAGYTPKTKWDNRNVDNDEDWKEFFWSDNEKEMKELENVKSGAPIKSIGKGKYEFLHKSLMEYFAGEYIRHEMEGESKVLKESGINSGLITDEGVLESLAERVEKDKRLKENLFNMVERSKKDPTVTVAAANAITVLNLAEVCFNGMDFRGIRIPGADLSHGLFDGADFSGANLRGCKFRQAWLKDVKFDGADMTDVEFGELPYIKTESEINAITYMPGRNVIASGNDDGTVRIWDASTGVELHCLQGHTDPVYSVAYSPDGKTLASASMDGTVKIWDIATGKELLCLKGHTDEVRSVAYSPDGKTLTSAGGVTVVVWDTETGEELRCLIGHTHNVMSVAYSPDGKTLASASGDETIRIWNAGTGEQLLCLNGHTRFLNSVAYSPDGKTLASGGNDNKVRIWDAITGKELVCLNGHTNYVESVAYSLDGKTLASASWDKKIRMWDATTGKELSHNSRIGLVRSVAYSPDGKTLASGGWDNTVRMWDATTGKELYCLNSHTDGIGSVAYSPDGKTIALTSSDDTVRIWDTTTGKELHCLKGHTHWVKSVAYSPDGKTLASASCDGTVRIWNIETGEELHCLNGHTGRVFSVAYNPDGKTLASGSRTVKIWDVETCKELPCLNGHTGRVFSVAYSPDGKTLASGSRTVKIWDAATGKELFCLKGHTDLVRSVAYSHDGKTLVSASFDKTVRIWDIETSKELYCLKGYTGEIESVAYSPDGKAIITGSEDCSIKKWNIEKVYESKRPILLYSLPRNYPLSLEGASINEAKLSDVNRRLLTQRGALATPAPTPLIMQESTNVRENSSSVLSYVSTVYDSTIKTLGVPDFLSRIKF